jgi:hypothetical protein
MRLRHVLASWALLVLGFFFLTRLIGARQPNSQLKIEDVMTVEEFTDSGISGLTMPQRKALNAWLNRYTEKVIALAATQNAKERTRPSGNSKSDCVPAIETTIASDFNGWDGETIFKLDNGQIWEQAEYDYTYSYSYRPDVTIYQVSGGCRMKVADENETILVRRIR